FTPEVGEYTAVYTTKDGKRKQTVKIICRDTVAPTVTFAVFEADVTVGAEVAVPEYAVTDFSGIKNKSITVFKPDGTEQTLNGGKWKTECGRYTICVEAEDMQGNKTACETYLTARLDWIDDTAGEDVLYSFNSEEYLNLVYGSSDRECFTPGIVREGYPEIADEAENNGVLRLSTDYNYGNVYARFVLHTGFTANMAKKIHIRLAVDRDTDYIKLMLPDGTFFGREMILQQNQWIDFTVDPIDYGYGNTFTNFFLVARADKGLNIWIDEITYDERWVDTALAENVIADFNETEYVDNIYQCMYSGVAYAVAGGSSFSIVNYPNDPTKKVLKVETTQNRGGFTYMFDTPVKTSEISNLVISIDCVYDCQNLWVGFMLGDYRSGGATGVQNWYDSVAYPDGAPWNGGFDNLGKVDALCDLIVPAKELQAKGEYVTGLFISVVDKNRQGNVLYIDEIRVEKN
ncbi:MAG: hypothetical protein ACI4RO_04680, partial [Candidatus Scatosoma sp.]